MPHPVLPTTAAASAGPTTPVGFFVVQEYASAYVMTLGGSPDLAPYVSSQYAQAFAYNLLSDPVIATATNGVKGGP